MPQDPCILVSKFFIYIDVQCTTVETVGRHSQCLLEGKNSYSADKYQSHMSADLSKGSYYRKQQNSARLDPLLVQSAMHCYAPSLKLSSYKGRNLFLWLVFLVILHSCVTVTLASSYTPPQVLYGVPDMVVTSGVSFLYKIPSDAFSGDIDHFEVSVLAILFKIWN